MGERVGRGGGALSCGHAEAAADWKSGGKIWAVEVIAPFGGAEEMVKDLKANVFPTRPVSYVALSGGKKDVKTL